MDIVFHLGAPCTDDDRILRCLLMNRSALLEAGIVVPKPRRYRRQMYDALTQLPAEVPDTIDSLIDEAIDEAPNARRLVLSSFHLLGPILHPAEGDRLFPEAERRMRWLAEVFPGHPLHVLIAIRNPATLLPACLSAGVADGLADLVPEAEPQWMRWSDTLAALRAGAPRAALTVWCNEDSPLIWADVLRAVADHPADLPLAGLNEFPGTLMTAEGLTRMEAYVATHPPKSDAQWRRIAAAFLEKFAVPDEVTMEVDLPGWTDDTVRAASLAYDADAARIAVQPGVTFIRP